MDREGRDTDVLVPARQRSRSSWSGFLGLVAVIVGELLADADIASLWPRLLGGAGLGIALGFAWGLLSDLTIEPYPVGSRLDTSQVDDRDIKPISDLALAAGFGVATYLAARFIGVHIGWLLVVKLVGDRGDGIARDLRIRRWERRNGHDLFVATGDDVDASRLYGPAGALPTGARMELSSFGTLQPYHARGD